MIRYFLKASKMNSAALERILANNLIAEQSLEALKREFCSIRDETITKKISEIQKENEVLKNQVEVARQQLIKLETANGKVQILANPGSKNSQKKNS